ncbi:MAG: S8/S53 family peptidase [Candidatus Heimdallarchaeaceae archaeon]
MLENKQVKKKIQTLIVLVIVTCSLFLVVTTHLQLAQASVSGYVTIYEPTSGGEYPYWDGNGFHVRYRVVVKSGWDLESSKIYIDGSYKGTFTSSIVDTYIHNLPAKIHTLKISVYCFRAFPFDYDEYDTFRTFYTYSAIDKEDIQNLRIDKLHNLGKGGQGVTICIMGDGLGFDNAINPDYHPMIKKKYSNILRDMEYFVFDNNSAKDNPSFKKLTSDWDQLSPEQKWDKIREKNAGDTENRHGTFALSVLVQIAPHAKYIFIEHKRYISREIYAVRWMAINNIADTYDIDVLNLYWSEEKSTIELILNDPNYWGGTTSYSWSDFENWFDDIANGGGTNQKVITVAPSAEEWRTFQNQDNAKFPAALPSVIGATGVYDNTNDEDSWNLEYGDNNGYGIDIAAIDDSTSIPWIIVSGGDKFEGTCNAAVFVAGIAALLKQYYEPLTISQFQTTLRYTGDAEGDSPKNYGNESGGAYESLDPYVEDGFGFYPGTYRIAWGIIDAYEAYLYIKEYIVP